MSAQPFPPGLLSNTRAEAGLLGCLLRRPDDVALVSDRNLFTEPRHLALFDTLRDLHASNGTGVDVWTVVERLPEHRDYLLDLVDDDKNPAAVTPAPLVRMLRDCAARRHWHSVAMTLQCRIEDGDPPAELQEFVGAQLADALRDLGTSAAPRRLLVPARELVAPPVTFVVDGLLPTGMLAILSGKDKRGKTLLAQEIARAVLRGAPLLGEFPTRKGPVVGAFLDDPLALTLARLDTLGIRLEGDFYLVNPEQFTGNPLAFLEQLEAEARQVAPALVILDALYLFAPPTRDAGNDAARMTPVMRALDRLATVTGAAVLVIAHDNKAGADVAGSYVVRAMAKAILRLTLPRGEEGEDEGDAPPTPRRLLTVESKLIPGTTMLLALRGVGDWQHLGEPRQVRAGDLRAAVLAYLQGGGSGTGEEIAAAVHRRRADVEAALASLVTEGTVTDMVNRTGKPGRPERLYLASRAADENPAPGGKSPAQEPEKPTNSVGEDLPSAPLAPRGNDSGREIGATERERVRAGYASLSAEEREQLRAEAAAGDGLALLVADLLGEDDGGGEQGSERRA